jgi:diguanylate cyclase (GGDEF)-like protein
VAFTATFFIVAFVLALLDLAAGIGVGWWLRGGRFKPTPPAALNTQQALEALRRLQSLTNDVAGNVSKHVSRLEAISQGLAALKGSSSPTRDREVVDAVARIVEVNEELTDQLAAAQDKLRSQAEQIEAQAAAISTDLLTGLANRRGFDDEMKRRFAQWEAQQVPLTVMLLDVDQLPKVQQAQGQQAADEVRREVAQTLQQTMRAMDLLARYDDNQFAVLLPGTTLDESQAAAKRLRANVAAREFWAADTQVPLTLSLGLAEALPGDSVPSLWSRIRAALTASHTAGKDRAHVHDGQDCRLMTAPEQPESEEASQGIVELDLRRLAREASFQTTDPTVDPLTGLPNRRSFFESLRNRVAECSLSSDPLSLLIVDIDGLQAINQQHGQLVGDVVLRAVTQVIRTATRFYLDLVARYEGGKLAVLLVDTKPQDATIVAERIRRTVAAFKLRAEGTELAVTVSVGIAEFTRGEDAVGLIKSAESAVRSAKLDGRNCTHLYDHALKHSVGCTPKVA